MPGSKPLSPSEKLLWDEIKEELDGDELLALDGEAIWDLRSNQTSLLDALVEYKCKKRMILQGNGVRIRHYFMTVTCSCF